MKFCLAKMIQPLALAVSLEDLYHCLISCLIVPKNLDETSEWLCVQTETAASVPCTSSVSWCVPQLSESMMLWTVFDSKIAEWIWMVLCFGWPACMAVLHQFTGATKDCWLGVPHTSGLVAQARDASH